jgi:hypothetical protein
MRFARWVFLPAGVLGILALVPPYFMERSFGEEFPPPINHPEWYYGFLGVGLAWQFLFLVIARDPIRFRPAMLPSMLEKGSYVGAIGVLFALERVPASMLGCAAFDAVWLGLFVMAYVRTPKR